MTVQRFSHAAMATVFEIRCVHPDAAYAAQAAQAAFALVDRLEQELSRFVGNSDVTRVNALAAGQTARVLPWTMECLQLARYLFDLTGGAFDVSIGTGLDGLELDPDGFAVHARRGGARLDLGGIGKGYAVDRVAELLEEWDIHTALVHGGWSSVLALDAPPEGDGWPLTLRAPRAGGGALLARISAVRRAFSASGMEKGDHIVDPRSGRPAPKRVAWVAVPSPEGGTSPAAMAEGLSTAFMVLSAQEIERLSLACPGVEAWVVLDTAELRQGTAALVHAGGTGRGNG